MTTTLLSTVTTGDTNTFQIGKTISPTVKEIKEDDIYTIDDLIINRASIFPDKPVVGYPASPRGKADYVYYSNKDLDRFADEAAKHLLSVGLPAKVRE